MQSTAYTFGDFHIDLAKRELRRAGELLAPSVKVFDCIAYLLERRDRAVGRDELIAAVWGRTDVTYPILGQLVIKARHVLGGSGDDQQIIRTLPRFGFRWVAEVSSAEGFETPRSEAPPAPPPAGQAENVPRGRTTAPPRRILAFLVIAIALGASLVAMRMRTSDGVSASSEQFAGLVAVLPVQVNAEGHWSWVRLGVMDLVAERLRGAGLPVVPSESVVSLAKEPADAAENVRRATGAQRILQAHASLTESGWLVRLVLSSAHANDRIVEVRADDVTFAAQRAVEQLLAAEGVRVVRSDSSDEALVTLLARARAALLKNNVREAQGILESAPVELKQAPERRRWLAKAEHRSGQLKSAEAGLKALLDETAAEANPRLRGSLLNDLGAVALAANQAEVAANRFGEAMILLAEVNDPHQLGRAHSGRGVAEAMLGRYEQARSQFGLARLAYGMSGDTIALATVEVNEAALEIRFDRPAAAKPMLEQAAERFAQLDARHELFTVQTTRMKVERALLQSARAYQIAADWTPRLGELQSPQVRQEFLLEAAYAQIATGRLADARRTLDLLAEEAAAAGDQGRQALWVQAGRARLAAVEGRLDVAIEHAAQAVDGLVLPDDAQLRASMWLTAIRALTALGREAAAETELQEFTAWAASSELSLVRMYATLAAAESADKHGRLERARESWETAAREAAKSGVPSYLAEVADSFGARLIAWGDLDRAGTLIGSVSRYAPDDFRCALLVARFHRAMGHDNDWRVALQQARSLAGERALPAE
jgi:DNA-binding winged helix-turn-helix (wHTH) protein/tetratricopeptide (TPR) repeat protein